MATKTRSPFQAPAESITSLAVLTDSTLAPEEKVGYVDSRYVEYINGEGTIAVIGGGGYRSSSYVLAVKTTLAPEDVYDPESYLFTNDGYTKTRAQGVWFALNRGAGAKTAARKLAEDLLAKVCDVSDPLRVEIDGKFAPALTIARAKWEAESDYRRDEARYSALAEIATQARVSQTLLALAVKEDRLIWSTPPVAPKQVLVTVLETVSGNLTERMVDEIVLATREVEGLGRIVHQGGVSEFLVVRRTRQQKWAVREILQNRENVTKTLNDVRSRVDTLLASLDKGETLGRGMYDTLRLADDMEKAQAAASAYAAAVVSADLPGDYALSLRKGEFLDEDRRYGYLGADVRRALEALAALNGMPLGDNEY